MFGHQDDKQEGNHEDNKDEGQHDGAAVTTAPDQPADAGQNPADDSAQSDDFDAGDIGADTDDGADDSSKDGGEDKGDKTEAADEAPSAPEQSSEDDGSGQHPGEPVDDGPDHISDIIAPAGGQHPQHPAPPMPIDARETPEDGGSTPHELIDIKQKALSELQPLIGQLDQTPEDRFRTLLMIIQASDNQDMIKEAYAAADDIKDDKVRAQALLDLVNEINYFTQHPAG